MGASVVLLYLSGCAVRGGLAAFCAAFGEKLFAGNFSAAVSRWIWLAVMALFLISAPFFYYTIDSGKWPGAPRCYSERAASAKAVDAASGAAVLSAALDTRQDGRAAFSFAEWGLIIWAAGFLFMLARFAADWILMSAKCEKLPDITAARALAALDRSRSEVLAFEMSGRRFSLRGAYISRALRNVRLKEGDFLDCPMAFGVIKPVIVISRGHLDKLNDAQLRFVFLHEFFHVSQMDICLGVFASLALSVQWFNPLCYFARRKFRAAIEICCDNLVLRLAGRSQNLNYGGAVIKTLSLRSSGRASQGAGIAENRKELIRRITMIKQVKTMRSGKTFMACAAMCAAVIGCCGFSVKAQAAGESEKTSAPKTLIYINAKCLDSASGEKLAAPAIIAAPGGEAIIRIVRECEWDGEKIDVGITLQLKPESAEDGIRLKGSLIISKLADGGESAGKNERGEWLYTESSEARFYVLAKSPEEPVKLPPLMSGGKSVDLSLQAWLVDKDGNKLASVK